MFDEDKINELLRGASPKKKTSSSKKATSSPKATKKKKEEENSRPNSDEKITQETLREIGSMIGSASTEKKEAREEMKPKEKSVSLKNMHQRQEYIHEKNLAADRLRRLKQAEKRINELERERRESTDRITEEQTEHLRTVELEAQRKIEAMQEQLSSIEELVSRQQKQIQALQEEKDSLSSQHLELQHRVQTEEQSQQARKEIIQIFQDHGLHSDEHHDVLSWLIRTGIFPLSYIQTQNHELLRQILHDKCHIQAANIPLPKESSDIYIDASFDRCPLSGGQNIMDQARLFKDECLIHGYTTIVMFGTQGPYEPLFQILFAHHALRITLSPPVQALAPEEIQKQVQANQLSFSWGEVSDFDVNHISKETTVGGFLRDLVSFLRSLS